MKILAIVNPHGGCGKTTTAANLSVCFANAGKSVLAMDFDNGDLFKKLTKLIWTGQLKLHNLDFFYTPIEGEEEYIAQRISKITEGIPSKSYDYVIIDSPPSLGLLTTNILTVATDVLVPIRPELLDYNDTKYLTNKIDNIRRTNNPDIKLNGFLITMINRRCNPNSDFLVDVITKFAESIGTKVYKSQICHTLVVGTDEYKEFVNEYLEFQK